MFLSESFFCWMWNRGHYRINVLLWFDTAAPPKTDVGHRTGKLPFLEKCNWKKNSIRDLSRCQYASEQCSHARTYFFHHINFQVNPLSANPTKWSNTFKLFVANCERITLVCLNILWGWRLRVNIFFLISSYFIIWKYAVT